MPRNELDDYCWLASDEAEPYLAHALVDRRSTVALVAALRKELSPARAHLVAAQVELRERARRKFAEADAMLFTRKLLEQATDETSARHKAERFANNVPVMDLCCGLGGDLLALAARGACRGIDIDPIAALLANANCQRLGLASGSAEAGDARRLPIDAGTVWHIDPDRRATGKRSIRAELWEPDADALRRLIRRLPDGAIKLAPASVLPSDFACDAECEWIGQPRACRQQIAWLGKLARHPALHTATVLGRNNVAGTVSFSGLPDQEIPTARKLGKFVHEPHAAVLASRLSGVLAENLRLEAVTQRVAYLTSDQPIDDDPRIATFEVLEALPFDIKQVKQMLRKQKMGRLEIKHRGLQLDPDLLRKRLHVPGDQRGCLIIVGGRDNARAILTRRRSESST